MKKETLFTIDIKELDNPFEREKLESLPNYILVELLIRHLKREIKAIEWVHKHILKNNCKGITIIDWDELSNPNDLLEILGDKENE